MNTSQTFKKLPGMLAITRGLTVSDALMFSDLGDGTERPLPVLRHGIRGTQNVNDKKVRNVSNIQMTDSAKTDPAAEGLVARFGLRMAKLGSAPIAMAAGKSDSAEEVFGLRRSLDRFIERAMASEGLREVSRRYARNIANGRWLWRNRTVGTAIQVTATDGEASWSFDALRVPLHDFGDYSAEEQAFSDALHRGLTGVASSFIEVKAEVSFGITGSIEVYPSQNYIDGSSKKVSRLLYCLGMPAPFTGFEHRYMGQAALRDQKVANALRTIDTWYPNFSGRRPISVEPNGANLDAQEFFRPFESPASAFKMMLRLDSIDPDSNDGMFMIACLMRGGVYSEKAE